ncbi:MAG: hypothetical protein Q8S54_07095 [Bacteroidota bacterium]|nr:hypothetical protein [Bacteroidota bacterium]
MTLVNDIKKLLITMLLLSITCFTQAQMTADVPVFVDIQLESGAITVPSFAGLSDLTNGLLTSAVLFKVKANNDWKVDTEIGSIISTPVPGGPPSIDHPLTFSNFSYMVSPDQDDVYNPAVVFTSTLATILTGVKQGYDKKFSVKFKITPGLSVDPAAYTIPIIYTISPL